MDEYIVSARKYRPDTFEMVVGQDAITQTLKNAIINKQLGQAYLFCGPRGVGKTTCARIFAKTINCSNLSAENEPCNECESCKAFNESRSFTIHELDAASNNSVEDIRALIDQVRIPPQIGTYSVYIIDEVHMLSQAAFNAFLKTLEEPPKHVIFILATTEKHKILSTILSRCQIFDFNRIGIEDIRNRLKFVATKEGITVEDDALHVIAQKADGAMRDALSIFDQIVSFCGKNVTYKETIKTLNVLDYEVYFKITDAILAANYAEALSIFDSVLRKGFDGSYFINGLASHFRDILVCKDPQTINLIEVGESTKAKYMEHAQKCSVQFLFNAMRTANGCDLNYKASQNKRLLIEMSLMTMCNYAGALEIKPTAPQQVQQARQPQNVNPQSVQQIQKPVQQPVQPTIQPQPAPQVEPKPAEPLPQPKPVASNLSGLMGASINSSMQEQIAAEEKKKYNLSLDGVGTDDYSEEQVQTVWNELKENFDSEGYLASVYRTSIIKKCDDGNYRIVINDATQLNACERKSIEVLAAFRHKLNNRDFNFEFIYEAPKVQEQINVTNEDILVDMVKNNKEVKKLYDVLALKLI